MIEAVERAGGWRLRLADTVGVLDPLSTARLVSDLKARTSLALEFHGHDDLGLATANTLAALRAGCAEASVTVLGLGERAGNAALEQVAVASGAQAVIRGLDRDADTFTVVHAVPGQREPGPVGHGRGRGLAHREPR